ncbi:hypothetical protein PAPYR_2901 [Paratrimastix pyriformis]|uniref:Uncharacterized protein n=1 Tax=Paratrimastix pyriformis TaxID=342808 RepID=A0ABQ8URI3_9EUKA|nr:hypothetical protein PAPYR_2901 [Paratrimastix pyriformis]
MQQLQQARQVGVGPHPCCLPHIHPCLTHPCLAHPCLTHPCLTHPCLTHPCLAHPCLAHPCLTHPCLTHPASHPCLTHPCLAHPCLAHPCLTHPCLTYTPASHTPASHTPASHTPASHTPASHTPASHTPLPHTPLPHTPLPRTPLPRTPLPRTPVAVADLPAGQCYPSIDERFAIYVKSKDWEQQTSAGGDLRSAHVMSVFTFKRHFSMAQKYHEAAKGPTSRLAPPPTTTPHSTLTRHSHVMTIHRVAGHVLLAPVVDQPRIPQLTATIVDSEAKAREYYELLLESHPNSLQILRASAYGPLPRRPELASS